MPPTPRTLWSAWSLEPLVLVGVALAAWGYARGVAALWRRAGPGHGVHRSQALAFAGGLLALVVALVSPLDALSDALFSAHMVQHLVLLLVAAPLLALGLPLAPLLWALPDVTRRDLLHWWREARLARAAWHALTQPVLVWTLHTGALWLWHLPALYQAALHSPLIHLLEHATFLLTALLFWWTLVHPAPRGRLGYGPGVLFAVAASMQSSLLGILMTFSPTPWYPDYATSAAAWGLTPHLDQQLAGLIMWVPAGVVYFFGALAVFGSWLLADERRARRGEGAL